MEGSITEQDSPRFEEYLPSIKGKLRALSNFKVNVESWSRKTDKRIKAPEDRFARCPHCGKDL